MQEIAYPDAYAIEDEQRHILYFLQRHNTFKDAINGGLHLIVEHKMLAEHPESEKCSNAADSSNKPTCSREH